MTYMHFLNLLKLIKIILFDLLISQFTLFLVWQQADKSAIPFDMNCSLISLCDLFMKKTHNKKKINTQNFNEIIYVQYLVTCFFLFLFFQKCLKKIIPQVWQVNVWLQVLVPSLTPSYCNNIYSNIIIIIIIITGALIQKEIIFNIEVQCSEINIFVQHPTLEKVNRNHFYVL